MAITYTWTIESMSVLQTPDPDFVVTARADYQTRTDRDAEQGA